MSECWVIGVLETPADAVTAEGRERLAEADLVIGAPRMVEQVAPWLPAGVETRDLTGRFKAIPDWVREAWDGGRRPVVLATGDPLFFGVTGLLSRHLPAGALRVAGNRSTMQLAFERLALPWQDAARVSVHGRDGGEWSPDAGPDHPLQPLLEAVRHYRKVGCFTDPANSPGRIARMLVAADWDDGVEIAVAERLGTADERVIPARPPAELTDGHFADPNVVVITRDDAPAPAAARFGLGDGEYAQRRPGKGLITKREVRATALGLLGLGEADVVWDIGAGSGSVGLEAARLCPEGSVYAVEKNTKDCANIETNRSRFGVTNHRLHQGQALEALADWPDPDAVFVGGSGGELEGILEQAWTRLRPAGRLVVSVIALENLQRTTDWLEGRCIDWELSQIQISRSRPVLDMHRLEALSPVWLIHATNT